MDTKHESLGGYTIAEAAEALGITRQSLHFAVKAEKIKVMRFGQKGDVVIITQEALDAYKKTRKVGRPKK
jgi:excisionase family DNA binding protein